MTLRVTVDNTPLDDPAGRWWVSDRTGETSAPSLNLATLNTPAAIGEIDAPSPGYGAAVWPLVMCVAGFDYDDACINRDALDALLLNRHRLVEIVKHLPGRPRLAHGMITSGTEVSRLSYGQRIDISYPVRIPAGRWFDPDEQDVTINAGLRISGTDQDGVYRLPALMGGSRDMDPVITTTGDGSATDVRVTDVESGQWVRVADYVTPGAMVRIDPNRLTVTVNGILSSGLLDFSPRDFHLSPQATVRVQRNNPAQPVTITARRAWA